MDAKSSWYLVKLFWNREGRQQIITLDYHSNMLFIFWAVNSRPPAAGTLYNQILIMTNIMAGYLAMHPDHFLLT
jgi:hypothetical protein